MRKKQADSEKAELDTQLKSLEIKKKMGEVMPIDLMGEIFTINIQTIFRTLENEIPNIATVFNQILGGDRSHLSEMTKQMREILQKAIEKSKETSAVEIKNAINNYAQVRE